MIIQITLTGNDSEQALEELISNIEYDNLDCKVEVVASEGRIEG